ncbi:hypothetical protein ACIBEA_40290 [Streptomyces sp. NPDC051555]|uniref:hypothetical protein n=1 Tax=Streptomyces sp. NPDC051555 TaxID=3365657 RepID=UPI0037A80C3F
MTSITPSCVECGTAAEPIVVEGEDAFRCLAPECGRRTYGTGAPGNDQDLPSYTETGADGAVVIYHGTGEVDIEATAENAAQGESDEDLADEEPAAPRVSMVRVYEVRVKDLAYALAGGWVRIYGDPAGWRHFIRADYDPDDDTTVTITYSDGEVGKEEPWPQARLAYGDPREFPTTTGTAPVRNR